MVGLIGKEIGKYRITERIGTGGMADVYLGKHRLLDRLVAIKVLHGFLLENRDFVERFKREANAAANLRHPNIVQLFDFDIQDEIIYMVLEYIDGTNLQKELAHLGERGERIPAAQITAVLHDVASALDYAHSQGMLHRDVKPSNILLDKRGRAYLTDFGIARILSEYKLTATGTLLGTPTYMSPEQCMGEVLTEKSDLYALGIIIFEILTGRVPFDALTPLAILQKQISAPIPDLSTFVDGFPFSMQEVINKAIAKAPADRYPTAQALESALRTALGSLASSGMGMKVVFPPDSGAEASDDETAVMEEEVEQLDFDTPTVVMDAEEGVKIGWKVEPAEDDQATPEENKGEGVEPQSTPRLFDFEPSTAGPGEKKDAAAAYKPQVDKKIILGKGDHEPGKLGGKTRHSALLKLRRFPVWGWVLTGFLLAAVAAMGLIFGFGLPIFGGGTDTLTPVSAAVEPVDPATKVVGLINKEETTPTQAAAWTVEATLAPERTSPPISTPKPTATPPFEIRAVLDADHREDGLYLANTRDLDTEIVWIEDDQVQAWRTGNGRVLPSPDNNSDEDFYMAFYIDDNYIYKVPEGRTVGILVEYLDEGFDRFRIQYDAHSGGPYHNGKFKDTEDYYKTDSGVFKTAIFILTDAIFLNRNNGYDFRLDGFADGYETIRAVTVVLFPLLDGSGYFMAGEESFNQGEYETAIAYFNLAVEAGYETVALFRSQAEAYIKIGDIASALLALDRGLEVDPNAPSIHRRKGGILYTYYQDAENALLEFNLAVANAENDPWVYASRAWFYKEMDQYDLCVEDYSMFFALGEEHLWSRLDRGLCYVQLGEIDLARQDFERFLVLSEGVPESAEQREQVQAWLEEH